MRVTDARRASDTGQVSVSATASQAAMHVSNITR